MSAFLSPASLGSSLRKFRAYLLGERGNSENTANRALTIIQIFVRLTIRDGLMTADDNPFLGIKLKWKEKKRLTRSEIEALSSIHLRGKETVVRDIFLFPFYFIVPRSRACQ